MCCQEPIAYGIVLENIDEIGDHSLALLGWEPIGSHSEPENHMENEHPSKVINSVHSDGIGEVLHGNLIRTPGHHRCDRQEQRNPVVVLVEHG